MTLNFTINTSIPITIPDPCSQYSEATGTHSHPVRTQREHKSKLFHFNCKLSPKCNRLPHTSIYTMSQDYRTADIHMVCAMLAEIWGRTDEVVVGRASFGFHTILTKASPTACVRQMGDGEYSRRGCEKIGELIER